MAVVTVGRLLGALDDDVTAVVERGALVTMVGSTLTTGVEVQRGTLFTVNGCQGPTKTNHQSNNQPTNQSKMYSIYILYI